MGRGCDGSRVDAMALPAPQLFLSIFLEGGCGFPPQIGGGNDESLPCRSCIMCQRCRSAQVEFFSSSSLGALRPAIAYRPNVGRGPGIGSLARINSGPSGIGRSAGSHSLVRPAPRAFFRPDRQISQPSRAGAVKAGRALRAATEGLALIAPSTTARSIGWGGEAQIPLKESVLRHASRCESGHNERGADWLRE
jgi:hypothetical protein